MVFVNGDSRRPSRCVGTGAAGAQGGTIQAAPLGAFDGRRYRVILRDGEPIAVAVWVVEEFGLCNPHAYWRRVWAKGGRAPGRVVRGAIAKAMAAPMVTLVVD